MDSQFTAIIQRLAAERGGETLFRAATCKSLLADYTRGEYNKESRVFLQAVDAGLPKILAETTELESCKDRMVQRLQDEYFLSREAAWDVVALLSLVLRNDTSGIPDAVAATPDKKTGGVSRYYLSVNYRTTGPFEPDAVKVMIERGQVTGDYHLRKGEDSAWEPIGSLPEFKALLDAQSAAPIPDQNAAPPAPPPKKKHTLRNALIGTAAIVILIVWAANSGQNSPGGGASTQNGNAHSPGGGRDSRVIARYYGTMARAGESLPIRLSWGGIVNGEAVNTSYLYTKYNIPITLNGFVSKDGVLYLEENNESGGVFAFENFKEGAGVLPGIWFTPHDSSKVYEVTLTKE